MKAYLANDLFSEACRMYNGYIAMELRKSFPDLQLYLPQENLAINDKSAYAESIMISDGDDDKLLESDFMVAVIDGADIDSGVACEIGKFDGYNLGQGYHKPIFALFTDTRQQGRDNRKKIDALIEDATENQFPYRNLYVIGTIKLSGGQIATSVEQLIDNIKFTLDN